jgi:hypothetical protein
MSVEEIQRIYAERLTARIALTHCFECGSEMGEQHAAQCTKVGGKAPLKPQPRPAKTPKPVCSACGECPADCGCLRPEAAPKSVSLEVKHATFAVEREKVLPSEEDLAVLKVRAALDGIKGKEARRAVLVLAGWREGLWRLDISDSRP